VEGVNPEVVRKLIDKNILTTSGRQKIAKGLQQPLRYRADYKGQGRKAYLVEDVPFGTLPIFDADPDMGAYFVGDEGQGIVSIQRAKRAFAPFFMVTATPLFPIEQIAERRYDLPTRGKDLAVAEVNAKEDSRVFALMDAVQATGFGAIPPNPDFPVAAPMTPEVLADAFAEIEQFGIGVARIFMNAKDFADIRKLGRDTLDLQNQAVLYNTGVLATIWGAQILVSRVVSRGLVYVCGEKKYYGRILQRIPLTVLNAEDNIKRVIGYSVFEQISILNYNPFSQTRLVIIR
jgi:hypothetical protein